MTSDAFARIMDKYLHLDLYPDALAALAAMKDRKLAILSNGSPDMLDALVKNSGLDRVLDATISVDAKKIFKPSPDAYTLIESTLHIPPARGAVHLLEPVGRLRRQGVRAQRRLDRAGDAGGDGAGLRREAISSPPLTMFKAIRTQMDELGLEPDYRIHALAELPDLVAARKS